MGLHPPVSFCRRQLRTLHAKFLSTICASCCRQIYPEYQSCTAELQPGAGCTKANLNSTVASYAAELAREETAHTQFLYQALTAAGASPVCPQVNIGRAGYLSLQNCWKARSHHQALSWLLWSMQTPRLRLQQKLHLDNLARLCRQHSTLMPMMSSSFMACPCAHSQIACWSF